MASHNTSLEEWEEWDASKGSFLLHATSGSIAGAAEHTLIFPLDTVKTYLQAEGTGAKDLKALIKNEGRMRLWRGVSTMLSGCVPAHAAYFTLYEWGKAAFGADGQHHAPLGAALSGVIATISHDSVMTPMDVVKQRMQLGLHSNMTQAFRSIIRTEGSSALFISFPTTLIMNLPFAAVSVAANESLKKIVNPTDEYNVGAYLFSGGVAGALAGAVTTPLDVIKTRLQTQHLYSTQRHVESSPRSSSSVIFEPNRGSASFKSSSSSLSPPPPSSSSSSSSSVSTSASGARSIFAQSYWDFRTWLRNLNVLKETRTSIDPLANAPMVRSRLGRSWFPLVQPHFHSSSYLPTLISSANDRFPLSTSNAAAIATPASTRVGSMTPYTEASSTSSASPISSSTSARSGARAGGGASGGGGGGASGGVGNGNKSAGPLPSCAGPLRSSENILAGHPHWCSREGIICRASPCTIDDLGPAARRYNGFLDTARRIYAEEGIIGFCKGARPRMAVQAPAVAISWTSYETAKEFLGRCGL